MSESYRALCSDFYVNQKLAVKMDLPRGRDTVLELFERVRRQFPGMSIFRRYRDELALESAQADLPHRWLAVRTSNIRSGVVNAGSVAESYGLHRAVLDIAPVFLNISPLDIDYVELLYGFDLAASGNHDAIVFDAFLANTPLAAVLDIPNASPIDCQPLIGFALQGGTGTRPDMEVHFEVKTRGGRPGPPPAALEMEAAPDPISVYLTIRKFGAVADLKELLSIFDQLAKMGEELTESRVVPGLLVPIRDAIASGNS